jgi:hypothetical protein
MNNFEQLRKKVFIKEKVEIKPKFFKNNRLTTNSSSDFSLKVVNSVKEASILSQLIDSNRDSSMDFLLPTPADGDPTAIKIKIYLFSTPKCL